MRRPFGCHCMVRHAVHFPGARAHHRSLFEPGRQLDDSADRQGSQIVRARRVPWLILPISAEATFLSIAVSS
jgi:hypothetical protein